MMIITNYLSHYHRSCSASAAGHDENRNHTDYYQRVMDYQHYYPVCVQPTCAVLAVTQVPQLYLDYSPCHQFYYRQDVHQIGQTLEGFIFHAAQTYENCSHKKQSDQSQIVVEGKHQTVSESVVADSEFPIHALGGLAGQSYDQIDDGKDQLENEDSQTVLSIFLVHGYVAAALDTTAMLIIMQAMGMCMFSCLMIVGWGVDLILILKVIIHWIEVVVGRVRPNFWFFVALHIRQTRIKWPIVVMHRQLALQFILGNSVDQLLVELDSIKLDGSLAHSAVGGTAQIGKALQADLVLVGADEVGCSGSGIEGGCAVVAVVGGMVVGRIHINFF